MTTLVLRRRLTAVCTLAAAVASTSYASALAGESEAELLATFRAPDASAHAKALACEKLATVGGAASVPPLADLLGDPKLAHYARYALQTNPEAGPALRNGLDRLDGDHLVGLINTLAARRDPEATGKLFDFLQSTDPQVAAAAAGALATIATPESLAALRRVAESDLTAFYDPVLQAAYALVEHGKPEEARELFDQLRRQSVPNHVKHAATLGLLSVCPPSQSSELLHELLTDENQWEFEAGLQGASRLASEAGTNALTAVFEGADPKRQERILAALARRGDRAGLPTVRGATTSEIDGVRGEALVALGRLGDSTDIPGLIAVALDRQSPFRQTARDALVAITSSNVNESMTAMLEAPGRDERLLAADVLGRRRAVTAAPRLFEVARESGSEEMRIASLEAIKRIGPAELMLPLLDHASSDIKQEERKLAEEAALSAALKAPDRDVATGMLEERLRTHPSEQHRMVFLAFKSVGGPAALGVVSEAATGSDRDLQDHATRVLGAWPTADAAPVLLEVAGSDHPYRIRALRGYLRIARQLNVNLKQKVEMCRDALGLVERPSERELVLEVLTRTPTADSLGVAQSVLSAHPSDAAKTAVVAVAELVKQAYPELALDAAQQVAESDPSPELLARARAIIDSSNRSEEEKR